MHDLCKSSLLNVFASDRAVILWSMTQAWIGYLQSQQILIPPSSFMTPYMERFGHYFMANDLKKDEETSNSF